MALLAPVLACLLLQEQPKPRLDLVHPPVATTMDRPYRLDAERDGLVYRGDHFTARVAPDGSVRFDDKGGSSLLSPWPSPLPAGTPTLAGMLRGLLSKREFRARARPRTDAPPPQTTVYIQPNRADPRELCQDPKAKCFVDQRKIVVQAAVFADWEMLLLGVPSKTPHREDKARFLAATAALRDRMAQAAHEEDLKTALLDLPALLDKVWTANRDTPAEGRRLLYELWSEYAHNADSAPACATILGFIRRRLPAGSPNAYTNDELAKYRAAGPAGFDPY